MTEDLLDHGAPVDRRDQAQRATAFGTGQDVDDEGSLQ